MDILLERELTELQEHIAFLAAANAHLRQENEQLRTMLQRSNHEQSLDLPVDIRISVLSGGAGIQLHPGVT
jgi:regulator of replication initiation timing